MFTKSLSRVSSLLVIATLSACGAETKSNPEATPDSPADTAAEAPEPVAKAPTTVDLPSEAPRAVSGAPSAGHALYLTDASKLPDCDAAAEGRLVYLVASKEFQACAQGQWQVVDLRGPQGEAGKDGVDGADGQDGADNRIVANTYCSRATANGLFLQYDVNLMSSGDVFTTCSVGNSSREHSATKFHSANSAGASSLGCIVGYDLDTADFGFISFATSLGIRSFTIEDNGSTKIDFAAEECTTTVY